jgi:hypothetical protein
MGELNRELLWRRDTLVVCCCYRYRSSPPGGQADHHMGFPSPYRLPDDGQSVLKESMGRVRYRDKTEYLVHYWGSVVCFSYTWVTDTVGRRLG